MNIYDIFNGKKRPKQSTVSESRIEIIHEFAEPEPGDSGESGVPEQVHQLANRWWNYADPEDQEKIEAVLRSLGWTISQVESEDDAVQLQYRDGSVEFISADEFDPDMHEDTDQFSSAGLNGVAATQDSDNVASPVGSGVEESSLNEFAPPGGDDGGPDEDEILFRLAKQWWLGTEQDMARAERTLASMGWEIGEDEGSYDDGGVFVVRAGDVNGRSYQSWPHEELVAEGVAEGSNDGKEDNFTIDDIKNLEKIRDFETLKAHAKELIKGKPARRMKPEKISWFYNHIDTLKNPLAVIKMMYDLMLAGEGHKVIGSRNSMSSNSYRTKFGEQGVAETAPLTRDTRRELVAPTDRDRIRRELWKYVRSLDQEGMSNRAHAMAHSCPTWGRLYHQFNDDVSQLLSKAPTELLAQALREIQSKFQGVTEADYEIHHHDPEGRLKARYHHGSEYTDDVIRKDADYHQKRNPKDTIKVFKDKKPMESQGVEEGYVDFHGNRENTPQIVWWRKPAGDNIYWKVFPTLSMASRATTNLANSLYKKYGKYLETGNVNFDPTNSAHCRAIDANKYMTESIKQKIQELEEHIGKVKSGYRLYSHTGKNLGTFPNKAGAKKHEREVQYFKHASEGIDEGSQSFHNGMQVKLTPEYADRPDEIFTVSHCDQERGRCWIGDEQGRGWSAKFDQLIPVEDDDDELDINENYLHQLKLAGYEIL